MTLTTEPVTGPETPSPTPPNHRSHPSGSGWSPGGRPSRPPRRGRSAGRPALDDGDRPSRIDTGRVVAEHGSVRAIEHRDELAAQGRDAMSRTVAEHGSISAIEHRDEVAGQRRDAMSRTVAEHGSISAIEHRDELAVPGREAMSRTVAEHGSISAIEHRDDLAAVANMARAKGLTGLSPASLGRSATDTLHVVPSTYCGGSVCAGHVVRGTVSGLVGIHYTWKEHDAGR